MMTAEPTTLTDRMSAAALSDIPCSSPLCLARDVALTDAVRIESLKTDADGWVGHGTIHLDYCVHGRCRTCGRVFEAARTQIPVLLPELRCSTCDKQDYLRFKVQELVRTEDGYQFGVSIRCSHCANVGTVTKILKGLLSAISIDVGLTGISIKAGAK